MIGNLKEMNPEFLRAAYIKGYGISLFVGIGIPIPILDEDMAFFVSIPNEKIKTKIIDYGIKYKFTDLFILSDKEEIKKIYEEIEKYSVKKNPFFIFFTTYS